jgi:hypothetical protein
MHMNQRYDFPLTPWTGIFGTFATTRGWVLPKEGVWFWAEFPERKPYIRRGFLARNARRLSPERQR